MARWIKITEDSGTTLVLDLEKIVAISHEPNLNNKKDKYIVYLPSGQLVLTRLENPEGYQFLADYMKVLEALSD
jgi:DNA-binding MarR family transcriptional regulator